MSASTRTPPHLPDACAKSREIVKLSFVFGRYCTMRKVYEWVVRNIGSTFSSPRERAFRRQTKDFQIVRVDEGKVSIKFKGSKYVALPLKFWMIERTIKHLEKNRGTFVPIGARIGPPYIPGSVEEAIWRDPLPEKISKYKVAPHIVDILKLADEVELGAAYKPGSRRRLQGVRARGK